MENYRYDEFLDILSPLLIQGEAITVPAASPYYVPLMEIPRQQTPSSVTVYAVGAGTTSVATGDAEVQLSNPTSNYNTSTMTVRNNPTQSHRSLLKFDVSSLPANPAQVKLRMQIAINYNLSLPDTSSTITIHNVTSSWVEGTVTWATQPTYNPVAQSIINFAIIQPYDASWQWVEVDITSIYNEWKSGTNNGLLLWNTSSFAWFSIRSREDATPSLRPHLVVINENQLYEEVAQSVTPGVGQFAVAYQTGRLRFHSSAAGLNLLVDYQGLGSAIDAKHPSYWGGFGVTTGSTTAIATTIPGIDALRPGLFFAVKLHVELGNSATLNINGLGAITMRIGASNTSNGFMFPNVTYVMVYNGSQFQVIGV